MKRKFDSLSAELKIDNEIIKGVMLVATDRETIYSMDDVVNELLSFSFTLKVTDNIPMFKRLMEMISGGDDKKVFRILFRDKENVFVYDDMIFCREKKFDEEPDCQIHAFYFERTE